LWLYEVRHNISVHILRIPTLNCHTYYLVDNPDPSKKQKERKRKKKERKILSQYSVPTSAQS